MAATYETSAPTSKFTLPIVEPPKFEKPSKFEKPYTSPSRLESFTRCPEAYRRRYLEGDIIPPAVAMLKGTGVHRGAQVNFEQKIATHEDLPAGEIVDAAVDGFETALAGGYELDADESERGTDIVIAEAKDETAKLARLHADQVAPEYQPTLVEQAVRVELSGSHDLFGVIDLADDQGRVVDHKTAGKRKSQADVDGSIQLTYYAAAHLAFTGQPTSEVRLEVLIGKKSGAERQVLASQRDTRDFAALAARINAVNAAIESGNFPPASSSAWWCSSRFCGYHATCPYVRKERK